MANASGLVGYYSREGGFFEMVYVRNSCHPSDALHVLVNSYPTENKVRPLIRGGAFYEIKPMHWQIDRIKPEDNLQGVPPKLELLHFWNINELQRFMQTNFQSPSFVSYVYILVDGIEWLCAMFNGNAETSLTPLRTSAILQQYEELSLSEMLDSILPPGGSEWMNWHERFITLRDPKQRKRLPFGEWMAKNYPNHPVISPLRFAVR
jgi:hypothetical protein